MAQDKVQLKREEVVGNDIVTEDIYPATTTSSIEDDTKGIPLDQTLSRMWNAINNKLNRVVNSVNGRTGVVILDASDVGLGNVDDVSFNDIKQWVINQMNEIFASKRILVRTYLSDIQTIVASNDKAYADVPFFTEYGEEANNDKLSYIGYIYWDEDDSQLKLVSKAIRVIGYTDRSLIYNSSYDPEHNLDYSDGGIGVNIWSKEDALKMRNRTLSRNGHTPSELRDSGLYIDKSAIVPDLYFFDGVYGNGDPDDSNAFLYYQVPAGANYKTISFKYKGDVTVWGPQTLYVKQTFKIGDIIFCNFEDDVSYYTGSPRSPKPGMAAWLIKRQPCIGTVTLAPTIDHPEYNYIVEWVEVKPLASNGLKYHTIHATDTNPKTSKLTIGTIEDPDNVGENFSGITTFSNITDNLPGTSGSYAYKFVLPNGLQTVSGSGSRLINSMTVNLSDSLCMIPVSDSVINMPTWPKSASGGLRFYDDPPYEYGCDNGSFIGVNLKKSLPVDPDTHVVYPVNKSGLKIDTIPNGLEHSGGLSVNAGDFLVIGKTTDDTATITQSDYYDYGKLHVNVNTNYGLGDVGDGALGITVYNQGGLTFNSGSLMVNPGKFISIHETNNTVDVNVDPKYGLKDVNNNNTLGIYTNTNLDGLEFRPASATGYPLSIKKGLGLTCNNYNDFGRDINHDLILLTDNNAPARWGVGEFWEDISGGMDAAPIEFTNEGGVITPAYEANKYYEVGPRLMKLTMPAEDYPADWGTDGLFFEVHVNETPKRYKPVVFENRGYIYPQYEPDKYYRRYDGGTDRGHLSVYLADSLSGTRGISCDRGIIPEQCYGGLRYIQHMYGGEGVGIGIRINEDRAWDDSGDFHSGSYYPSRRGSRGLEITDMNVLGIQLSENSKLEFDGNGCLQADTNVSGTYAMCAYKTTLVGRSDDGLPYDVSGGGLTIKSLTDVLTEINYLRDNGISWSPYNLLPGDTLIFVTEQYAPDVNYHYIIARTYGSNTYYTEDPKRMSTQICSAIFTVESIVTGVGGYLNNVSLYCTFSTIPSITVGTRLS